MGLVCISHAISFYFKSYLVILVHFFGYVQLVHTIIPKIALKFIRLKLAILNNLMLSLVLDIDRICLFLLIFL